MAATGEECFHQMPIQYYFDSGYDMNFDAAIEHYCLHFHANVIPAHRCGTRCPAYRPLAGTPPPISPIQPKVADISAEHTCDAGGKASFLRNRLTDVCRKVADNAEYLDQQLPGQERLWRKTEAWLSRQDTQPKSLERESAKANRSLPLAQTELQRIERQLDLIRSRRRSGDDLEQLWLMREKWTNDLQSARQSQQRVAAMVEERAQKEAERDQRYARWKDALERVALLKRLAAEVRRCVETRLSRLGQHISGADVDRIVHFLREVAHYAKDDIPVEVLKSTVEELSQRCDSR